MPVWWQSLKKRWGVASNARMAKLWLVFALCGSTTGIVGRYVLAYAGIDDLPLGLLIATKLLLITAIYPFILLTIGTLAGEGRWYVWFLAKLYRIRRNSPPPNYP